MFIIINLKNNIAFIGFMGVGKTTFGKMLADFSKKPFLDIDEKITLSSKLEVNEIFEKYGESYFRKLESKVCKEVSSLTGYVVSTGGGVVKTENNIKFLKQSCTIIHLMATPLKIYYNIKDDFTRPLLNNCENKLLKIESLLEERLPLYKRYCDFSIEVNEPTIEENFQIILNKLNLI